MEYIWDNFKGDHQLMFKRSLEKSLILLIVHNLKNQLEKFMGSASIRFGARNNYVRVRMRRVGLRSTPLGLAQR